MSEHPSGLFTVSVCVMSNFTKSRVLALQVCLCFCINIIMIIFSSAEAPLVFVCFVLVIYLLAITLEFLFCTARSVLPACSPSCCQNSWLVLMILHHSAIGGWKKISNPYSIRLNSPCQDYCNHYVLGFIHPEQHLKVGGDFSSKW